MSEKHLSPFLKFAAQACEKFTAAELEDFLKSKDDNSEKIDKVLCVVADAYNISVKTLKTSNSRGKPQTARFLACVILNLDLCFSTRYIANRVFGKWQTSVSRAIIFYKKLNTRIPEHKEFEDTYQSVQLKLKGII